MSQLSHSIPRSRNPAGRCVFPTSASPPAVTAVSGQPGPSNNSHSVHNHVTRIYIQWLQEQDLIIRHQNRQLNHKRESRQRGCSKHDRPSTRPPIDTRRYQHRPSLHATSDGDKPFDETKPTESSASAPRVAR